MKLSSLSLSLAALFFFGGILSTGLTPIAGLIFEILPRTAFSGKKMLLDFKSSSNLVIWIESCFHPKTLFEIWLNA